MLVVPQVHSCCNAREEMHRISLSGFACRDIKLIMEGKPHKLLESVAEDIAGTVLQDYGKVMGIKIKIQKPHVAIEGVVKYLGEPKQNQCSSDPPSCSADHYLLCTQETSIFQHRLQKR